eukprot:5586654-Pyramimonas_sp.AAC.1
MGASLEILGTLGEGHCRPHPRVVHAPARPGPGRRLALPGAGAQGGPGRALARDGLASPGRVPATRRGG